MTELKPSDEKQLEKFAEAVEAGKLNTIDGMIQIGEAVRGARDLTAAAGCKGKFSEWVETRCQFSRTTAYQYIAIADNFSNCKVTLRFQDGTISALAKSEPAAKEAKQLASSGKTITPELAKKLLDKHKKKPAKPKARHPEVTSQVAASSQVTESTSQESHAFTCPECGHHEADEDGECASCHAPPVNAAADDDDAGGYEPHEAKKPLDKLYKALGEAIRHYGDAKKILGPSPDLQAVFDGLDSASIAFNKLRKAFRRRPK